MMYKKLGNFKIKLFVNTYTLRYGKYGIVIEKEKDVVCVYAANSSHTDVYSAIYLYAPKYFAGSEINVFTTDTMPEVIFISAKDVHISFDFKNHTASCNKAATIAGSEKWGHDCGVLWNAEYENVFEKMPIQETKRPLESKGDY